MMKKSTPLLFLVMLGVGCIEPDTFTPEGTYVREAVVTVEAPVMSVDEQTPLNYYWNADDAIDFYYSPLKQWYRLNIDGVSSEQDSEGTFTSELELKNNVRSHVFYTLWPATPEGTIDSGTDPAELPLTLDEVQYYSEGYQKYMVSCGTALVRGDNDIKVELEPTLAVVELNITVDADLTVKKLKLSTVGAGVGKGISGAYKMDVTDNAVNLRESEQNSVTIDFGEEGVEMVKDHVYKAHAVMLPAKLNGLKFSVSGSTTIASLEISAYDAMDLKAGEVQSVNLHLVPGPIRQDYTFAATCGALGTSTSTSNTMLGFQGGKKTASTAVKGLSITSSSVEFEYIDGRVETQEAYWAIECSDWIHPSVTSGKGAATVDLVMLPNMKLISSAYNDAAVNLSATGTANTYIINKPGKYSFDASVMGNGDSGIIEAGNFVDAKGNVITTATISGGVSAGVVWQFYPTLISEVTLTGSTIEFSTGASLYPGNAVIALYDGTGAVIWSWQIWATSELDADDEITNANTNEVGVAAGLNKFKMMDRNLGALAKLHSDLSSHPKAREGVITVIQYTDESLTIPTGESFTHKIYQIGSGSDSYYQALAVGNILYQFGRKDPFMIPYVTSSRPSLIRFDGDNNEIDRIKTDNGGLGKGYNVTVDKAIANPGVFYKPNSTVNWLEAHNDYLWGNRGGNAVNATTGARPRGTKTIYDPCPVGYMVPPIDVWTGFSTSSLIGSWAGRGGYTFKANSSDTKGVFYPGSGQINSTGGLNGYGGDTYYWSNAVTGGSNNCHQLYIKNGTVNSNNNTGRGVGNHVRCVKIE